MPPPCGCPPGGTPSSEVTGSICLVPSPSFSQAPRYALPVHLCRFRVRSCGGLFPGTAQQPLQSDKEELHLRSVTISWPRTINLVPIDYGFRPRLRGRLTLRGLALRRNPWTFGRSVSHTAFVTHVSIVTSDTSSSARALPSQAYGTLRYRARDPRISDTRSFGTWLEPRYIVGAG